MLASDDLPACFHSDSTLVETTPTVTATTDFGRAAAPKDGCAAPTCELGVSHLRLALEECVARIISRFGQWLPGSLEWLLLCLAMRARSWLVQRGS